MKSVRRALWRIAGMFRSRTADIDAELESHVEMLADDYVRAGMTEPEARRAARLKLGGVEQTRERVRDQRGLPGIESFVHDVRFALRALARRPVFTAVAVLSLGIGIGCNATIYAWLRAIYLDPVPAVRDARSLVTINAAFRRGAGYSNSYADYKLFRDRAGVFDGLFAHEMEIAALSDGASAELTMGGIVSGNYFDVLGVAMARGRGFEPREDAVPDRDAVAVLSHGLWQRRFAGANDIVGRRVELNRVPFTVIGVTPRGFGGVYGGIRQDFWVPMHMARSLDPDRRDRLNQGSWMQIMGRPKPGAGLETIQARLDVLSGEIRRTHRKDSPDYRAVAFPLHRSQRGLHSGLFEVVRALAIAVGVVLLLACLNVANLLIARASDRSREMSLRLSLGASRGRLVRQLMTESTVLALLGGGAGMAIAWMASPLPRVFSRSDLPLELHVAIDWHVAAFLFAVTLAAAFVFGLLPALETSRAGLVDALKEGAPNTTSGGRRNLMRGALVAGQVALSMTAVVAALLFALQLERVTSADVGLRVENLLTAGTDLYAAGVAESRAGEFYQSTVQRLTASPEIESAAWTTFLPMSGSGGGNGRALEVQGYAPADGKPLTAVVDTVSPGYLRTMGIPLIAGREFAWSDNAKAAPVALVNQAFADEYLSGRQAVGAAIRVGSTWRTIAGVHRNYAYRVPGAPANPAVLLPFPQEIPMRGAIVVIRARGDAARAVAPLRSVVQSFDRNLTLQAMMTMEENVGFRYLDGRIATAVLMFFGSVACLLAGIGLYGVLATHVAQKRREFGIRLALGAGPSDLTRAIVTRTLAVTLAGIGVGLGLSIAFGRVLQSMLTQVDASAPWVYAIGGVVVCAFSLAAAVAPWRRVVRMDPASALRCE